MAAKVAFLRSKSPEGVEPRIDREARTLSRAGHEVRVILWDRGLEHPARERRPGYEIRRVHLRTPEGRPGVLFRLPRWWLESLKLLGAFRADVVHAIDLDCLPPALAARRLYGGKLAYDVFDFYAPMIALAVPAWVRGPLSRAERRLARRADLVILPDAARAAFFGDWRPRRLVEIMNVPEEQEVRGTRRDAFTVFYGGQIARDRGLPDLVRACEALGARLVVAGRGPDEASLIPLVTSSPAAQFLGTVPYARVLSEMASSDVVAALYDPAIPNNRWASPNKLFEAMMLGKPVLANNGTLLGEFVGREGVGVVAAYGDAQSVRKALEGLLRSPRAGAEMGARGRQLYEVRYRWDIMADRLVAAYRDVLGG